MLAMHLAPNGSRAASQVAVGVVGNGVPLSMCDLGKPFHLSWMKLLLKRLDNTSQGAGAMASSSRADDTVASTVCGSQDCIFLVGRLPCLAWRVLGWTKGPGVILKLAFPGVSLVSAICFRNLSGLFTKALHALSVLRFPQSLVTTHYYLANGRISHIVLVSGISAEVVVPG